MDVEEQENGLLDLLLVVAENLKLLLLGPLVTGLLALGIAPQHYTSETLLAIPDDGGKQVAAFMVSPLVLDPVIESMGLRNGRSIEKAREELAREVKTAVGRDNLLRLNVTARSPEQAQALSKAMLAVWFKSTLPAPGAREDLQRRLAYAEAGLESVRKFLQRLGSGGTPVQDRLQGQGGNGGSIVSVGELQLRFLSEVMTIEHALRGASTDVIRQQPSLPTEPTGLGKGVIVSITVIATVLAVLLWAFLRRAWRRAALDPETAEKQARLRMALGWGK